MPQFPKRDQCLYTSCYCEENIWHLCNYFNRTGPSVLSNLYVIFCSNETKSIPLWCQQKGQNEQKVVCWDYHVFLIYHKIQEKAQVFDFDTTLEFPCDFNTYFQQAIKDDTNFDPQYKRMFRIVIAEDYLNHFSSDRSHMLNEDGRWLSPPPQWPPIFNSHLSNLDKFWSMKPEQSLEFNSDIVSTFELRNRFFSL